MKKSFVTACFGMLLFAACKEVPPYIDFNPHNYVDTSYTVAAPATDLHNVLVEEFTGEGCSNCPGAKAGLDATASTTPGRVNIVSLYQVGAGLLVPPTGAKYDFRDSVAYDIAFSTVYNGINGLPEAGVDRVPLTGTTSTALLSPDWAQAISNELPFVDSLNMTVSSSYLAGIATVTVTLTYTKTVTTQQNISVVLVTDSVVDFQAEPVGGLDTAYMFSDILVGMISSIPFGDPVLSSVATKSPGQFLQRVYTYTVPTGFQSGKGTIVPAHCRVIAFVNTPGTGTNFQIYQSVQTPLMGP